MDYNADCADLFRVRCRRQKRHLPPGVSEADRFVLEQLWKKHDFIAEQTAETDQALRAFAEKAPIPEAQAREILRTIPGVGEVTTEAFLSEIGDVRRFSSQKQVTAYVGLAPGQRESAGKTKELGITHRGSKLMRWALNQAAWQLVRRNLHWRKVFDQLAKKRGKKRAITAISRRLLCVMVSMVTSGQAYRHAA